jgi:hypothetical protein
MIGSYTYIYIIYKMFVVQVCVQTSVVFANMYAVSR